MHRSGVLRGVLSPASGPRPPVIGVVVNSMDAIDEDVPTVTSRAAKNLAAPPTHRTPTSASAWAKRCISRRSGTQGWNTDDGSRRRPQQLQTWRHPQRLATLVAQALNPTGLRSLLRLPCHCQLLHQSLTLPDSSRESRSSKGTTTGSPASAAVVRATAARVSTADSAGMAECTSRDARSRRAAGCGMA